MVSGRKQVLFDELARVEKLLARADEQAAEAKHETASMILTKKQTQVKYCYVDTEIAPLLGNGEGVCVCVCVCVCVVLFSFVLPSVRVSLTGPCSSMTTLAYFTGGIYHSLSRSPPQAP